MTAKLDKRQLIMQAAEKLFTTRRFHEITMDDVSAAAGVAKGTLYRYFADKDELFFQTSTNGFDELCELITLNVPLGEPFADQILKSCIQISGFFEQRHQLMRMMQAEDERLFQAKGALRQRWVDKRKKLVTAIAGIIARGVAEGQVRRDMSAEVLAEILLGLMRMRAHDLADAPPAMRRHEVIIDLFRHGVGCASRTQSGDIS
jgi:AcrR family transcriptional regulator